MKSPDVDDLVQEAVERVAAIGHAFLPQWRPDEATIDVAKRLGRTVDLDNSKLLKAVPTVQLLKPLTRDKAETNSYSGLFGLGEFPLHTDLAQWLLPPRYLLLRCREGAPSVMTKVLSSLDLMPRLGVSARRALARPRNAPNGGAQCVLPLCFRAGDTDGFRWDENFLIPLNDAALAVWELMRWVVRLTGQVEVPLANAGDSLVLDNWRVLHGRGPVPEEAVGREIERVYLSELYR